MELYFATDIESTGNCAADGSMISIGMVTYTDVQFDIGRFSVNISELPGAPRNPETMAFWAKHPEKWAETLVNQVDPEVAMQQLADFVESQKALMERLQMIGLEKLRKTGEIFTPQSIDPVLVANPALFDGGFIFHYLWRFLGRSPFRHRCLDIRSYFAGMYGRPFLKSGKEQTPNAFRRLDLPMTHNALDDALHHGWMHYSLIGEAKRRDRYVTVNAQRQAVEVPMLLPRTPISTTYS